MIYKAIGLMSGSSLDGLDIVFTELQEHGGKWNYEILEATCITYEQLWKRKLKNADKLNAKDYFLLHVEYGKYIGNKINQFIAEKKLEHQVNLVCSHGHTTFHMPEKNMTHQLGEGSAIAAATRLPVISDLRAMDVALGGQGAPIVPLGEKLLFSQYRYFLNIGGIANVSADKKDEIIAFDICAANRILNMLANERDMEYDDKGSLSSQGRINEDLLEKLNALSYYKIPYPKSLSNSFGTEMVYPVLKSFDLSIEDILRTYIEHIAVQIKNALQPFKEENVQTLFITGGGAFNRFLIERIETNLAEINFQVFIPGDKVVNYKEALIMALLGVLRWREQYTVLPAVTGASRSSIGGALWLGNEA
jgi:anhydro-N-acetylmuramic acid kinase